MKKCLLLIVATVLFSPNVFALGKLGHQLVCQLSYQLLSSAQQQQLDNLLLQAPLSTKKLINEYNRQKANSPLTFANSCTWADAIKRDDKFNQFKSWHYINVDRNQQQIATHNCQKDCITYAISHHQEQLKNNQDTQQRLQALMFLGHWLGDIHQPFHVSFASDLGGNKTKVKPFKGRCNNLHWYWDECLLYPHPRVKESLYSYLINRLSNLNNVDMKLWQNSQITDWANESLTLARFPITQYCKVTEQYCQRINQGTIAISQSYHQQHQNLLHKRIQQAAVRLTSLLEKSLISND